MNGIVSLVSGTGGDGFRARYSVTTSGEIDRRWNLPVQGALAETLRRQGSPNDAGETGRSCRPRCLLLLLCRKEDRTEDRGSGLTLVYLSGGLTVLDQRNRACSQLSLGQAGGRKRGSGQDRPPVNTCMDVVRISYGCEGGRSVAARQEPVITVADFVP